MEKTALITGGTTRLGAYIASGLRVSGWRVVTTSHRAGAGADFTVDFTDPGAPARCAGILRMEKPRLVVNNAALFSGGGSELMRVNYELPRAITEAAAGCGTRVVVNILDIRILSDQADPLNAYERSKRALLAATYEDARRFLGTMRVNAVAPGPVLAPVSVHEKAGVTPFGRPGPEDIAEAVRYLAEAERVTGAVIPVDGGRRFT